MRTIFFAAMIIGEFGSPASVLTPARARWLQAPGFAVGKADFAAMRAGNVARNYAALAGQFAFAEPPFRNPGETRQPPQ